MSDEDDGGKFLIFAQFCHFSDEKIVKKQSQRDKLNDTWDKIKGP